MRDSFAHFDDIAKLLDALDPFIDVVNATKMKLVNETGCTEELAVNTAMALLMQSIVKNTAEELSTMRKGHDG